MRKMKTIIRQGWDMTARHKYVVVVLFLYRLLWGFFLYRFVDGVATPILARYPDDHPNADAVGLFLLEAQFRLMKTDLLNETLWMLGGLFLIRMLLTPLFHAGLYYSFHHSGATEGTLVLTGVRRSWKAVTGLYWAECALALLPAVWILPEAQDRLFRSASAVDWLVGLMPYLALWGGWALLVHLLLLFMQFGAVSREGLVRSLGRALRRLPALLAVSVVLLGAALLLSAAAAAASMLWTGFAAIVIHQSFHFIRVLLKLWTAASQYRIWQS